ncbi:MAG: hypothetical protein LBL90_04080 [Prevotellaceae bacterium]|nr:hypothetical protein [Prevotellaceae bacterium]
MSDTRHEILKMLHEKSNVKQKVHDNTFDVFTLLKEILHELTNDINDLLTVDDRRVRLEYRDRGKYEAEVKVAEDILIFSMHSNIFEFDRDHMVWQTSYVQKDKLNSYCGIISIYNFLADSFRYNRMEDLGYLIGRIFVNRENHYFAEGKRQMSFINSFGEQVVDKNCLKQIIEKAILYAIEFDLLVPPYDMVKIASVAQMTTKIENAKVKTGKRLGFRFNSDDVLAEERSSYLD